MLQHFLNVPRMQNVLPLAINTLAAQQFQGFPGLAQGMQLGQIPPGMMQVPNMPVGFGGMHPNFLQQQQQLQHLNRGAHIPPEQQFQKNQHPTHQPQQAPYSDKKEQYFDQSIKKALSEIKMNDHEIQGIKVKMPRLNLTNIWSFQSFLENETHGRKFQFLRKTLLNTKQIKKTLDIRKMEELQRQGKFKKW